MSDSGRGIWLLLITLGVGGTCLYGARALYTWWTGIELPSNLLELTGGIIRGQQPRAVAVLALLILLAGVAGVVGIARWRHRGPRRRTRGDRVARKAAARREVAVLGERAAASQASRLGVVADSPGLPIGRMVAGGAPLFSSWEFVCLMIAGPRTGKTTAWLVPRIFAAPGAVVATSNKRDIVDITREQRSQSGKTWVFDPQGIAGEEQSWWWDILAGVRTPVDAVSLAEVFIDSQRDPSAMTNAYFDGASKDLVAALLLAAALGGRDIRMVHEWLTRPIDDEPVRILERAAQMMTAQSLRGMMNLPAETRGGVYGGASQTMNFLLNDEALRWVLPPTAKDSENVMEFRPTDFVASTDTLYCLSQEGRGSASPIVTALTVAVIEAALEHAKTQPGGRLALPLFVALDEAANVCRWRELPDLYSHFGSRGIVVDTLLQSWSQGIGVWGDAGMNKLWSASNVKAYGGGVSEDKFLQSLSTLIGMEYVDQVQTSSGRQGTSRSVSVGAAQRSIAPVSELMAMPPSRAWVFASGAPAVYVRTVPYWETKKR
ncbi:MAG: type IV secretory system conjugative DNA transfer family protein [Pauljensenia sp.]